MATVVSAFFDIPSKRPTSEYLLFIQRFMKFHANIVFFTTRELLPIFQSYRNERIVYIVMTLDELEGIRKYGIDTWTHWSITDTQEVHYNRPYLGAVWHDKKDFVLKAIHINPFNTDAFIWCDAGCLRTDDWFPMIDTFGQNTSVIPKDKVILQYIGDTPNNHSTSIQYFTYPPFCGVAGAIIAGYKDAWRQYSRCYDEVVMSYIKTGHNPFVDQHIMTSTAFLHPETVQLICPQQCERPYLDVWFFFLSYLSK